ncbi:MAG: alkaline phosphatase D family protein [Chthoniobacterales bacterium]
MRFLPALLLLGVSLQAEEPLSRIAFGSCANEHRPQPVWKAINETKPQLFIFMGDNVYVDSADPAKLKESYDLLAEIPGVAELRENTPILATWDDHDYGKNDVGAEWEGKEASKEAFMEFFETPADSPLRKRGGVYDAKIFGPEGKRVQVILLDTRWFRGPLHKMTKDEVKEERAKTKKKVGRYLPDENSDSSMLGEEQWEWLAAELKKPAELRLLVSSIQVIPNEHGWEKWGNLPRERKKLLDVIRDNATNVIILSGDRHLSEISLLPPETDGGPFYPLYEVTSSGLNQTGLPEEENRFRVEDTEIFNQPNFGLIEVDWEQEDPSITLEIRDDKGKVVREVKTTLNTLKPCTQ